jgi:hypothetical protein
MKKLSMLLAVGAMILGTVPAQAKGPLAGVAVVHCQVTLGAFPATVKTTNATNCTGEAVGLFAGLTQVGPEVAVGVAAAATFTATVQYDEQCVLGEPPLVGFANGRITVAPVTVTDTAPPGAVHADGVFNTPYDWTRVGLVALVFDGKLATKKGPLQTTLTYNNGTEQVQDAVGSVALAAFVPRLGLGNVCPAGAPLLADVAAVDLGA